jgi:two-component system response regulator
VNKLVLYADDDADDRAWVSEACEALHANMSLHFVENGREILEYLKACAGTRLPSLIILDLNMPQLDGRQTLQRLKANPQYSHIPVAIVSTSSGNIDRQVCERLGASLFLVKPTSYKHWQNIIEQLTKLIG